MRALAIPPPGSPIALTVLFPAPALQESLQRLQHTVRLTFTGLVFLLRGPSASLGPHPDQLSFEILKLVYPNALTDPDDFGADSSPRAYQTTQTKLLVQPSILTDYVTYLVALLVNLGVIVCTSFTSSSTTLAGA